MRRRKPTAPDAPAIRPVAAAVPTPAVVAAPRRPHKFGAKLAVLALLGTAGWGAWSAWGPDPLADIRAALDRREFGAANELLTKRLAERPTDAEVRLLAVRAARRGGDRLRAAEHLRKYLDAHGTGAAVELESALLRAQGGDAAEAERLFAAHIDRPEAAETPFVLEAYLEGKLKVRSSIPDAVTNLRRAADFWLRLRPGRADQIQGRLWLAIVYEAVKDQPAGVAVLREVLDLDPDHFDARFLLALALAQEKPEESRHHLEVLREKYPANAYVQFGLATTYRVLGRQGDARRLLDGLLAGPLRASALVELASIDLDEGNVSQAEGRLRTALELSPNATEANLAMSRCQQLAGRPAEAAKYRQRFDEIEAARPK